MIIHSISIIQWIHIIWLNLMPLWIIGIFCCAVTFINEVNHHVKKYQSNKKIKGQEGVVIYPESQGIERGLVPN